jgi:hypothetical protein
MRIRKFLSAAALGVAALGLGACATGLDTTVSRYQAMPAAQGQTFMVVPGTGLAASGGLEFQRYAALVAQHLQARGYTPATDLKSANMIVQFDYGVDSGQTRIVEDPMAYRRFGYGPWGDPFYSPFSYPRFGYRSAYAWGWNDPFWYGGYGSGIRSYTEYQSQIGLHIRQNVTNAPLFDGRAIARSRTNRLDVLLPSLVDAMFTGFPGQNGETVRITIPEVRG